MGHYLQNGIKVTPKVLISAPRGVSDVLSILYHPIQFIKTFVGTPKPPLVPICATKDICEVTLVPLIQAS